MFNAGMVRPGSKVWIPVNTYTSDDPAASVTATTWLNTDCHVHKDGGTTQRASSAGETLSIDYDSVAGNHLLEIDTADNTTANFYEAGSTYHVRIEGATVDAGNVNAWIGTFQIGYPNAILNTTIATLASQVSFTLEEGPAEADALKGCPVIIHDLASAVQMAIGFISAYAVTTKTVTLAVDPAIFTMAAGDSISVFLPSQVASWNNVPLATTNPLPNAAADAPGGVPISDAGGLDLDTKLANTNEVTAARMAALTDWIDGGRLDTLLDAIPTTAMRGTDSAALASVATEARLAELDAANLPTDVAAIPTTAMRGTDSAALASVCTEGRLAELDAANLPTDVAAIPTTAMRGTDSAALASVATEARLAELDAANIPADIDNAMGATFSSVTDSLEAIRDRGDAAWTTGAGGSDRLLMVDTTIATLASQTSFTLTAGSVDDGAYVNCTIVIEDASTATQKAVGLVSAYTGATKTVTLKYDPGIFTMATTDKVYILAENALKSTDQNRQLDVSANGNAGIDWANVENPATALDLAGTDIQLADTTTTNTDMRGTDSAALASVATEARLAELDAANLPTDVAAIPTTAMRGTDSAALASVATEARLAELDAANLPTDIAAIPTTAMRGTDSAALASVATEARLSELDEATAGKMANQVDEVRTDTGEIGTAGAGLTDLGGMSTGMKGEVNTEVDGALDTAIPGSPTADSINEAIQNLAPSAKTIITGAATGTPTTTTMPASALTEATDDHYNGRIIIWTSGVLLGQATDITDYDGGTKTFTFTAVTEGATSGDTFVIL